MNEIKGLQVYLEGKKSFIGAAFVFVVAGLQALGYVDVHMADALSKIGEAIFGIGLADKLRRMK